jgi:hypothetical protein
MSFQKEYDISSISLKSEDQYFFHGYLVDRSTLAWLAVAQCWV